MYVQTEIWVRHRDVRPFAGLLSELVDDGILHFIGYKLRVAELLREHYRVDGKGLVVIEICSPVYFLDFFVDIIRTFCLEVPDGFQDSDGSVRLKVGTVHQFLVTCKRNHSSTNLYIISPQLGQFFRQYRFQSHKRFGDQFKILFH